MVENEHPLHRHREERSDAAISLQTQPYFYEQMVGLKVRSPQRYALRDVPTEVRIPRQRMPLLVVLQSVKICANLRQISFKLWAKPA
jgi:hypothetical protein